MSENKDTFIKEPILADMKHGKYSIDYTDGEIYILDNVKDLTTKTQNIKLPVHMIILSSQGQMQMQINSRTVMLHSNEILMCPANAILSEMMFSSDFECKICALTDKVLQDSLRSNVNLWNNALYIKKVNLLKIKSESVAFMHHILEILRYLMKEKDTPYRKEKIQNGIGIILLSLCGLLYQELGEEDFNTNTSRKEVIFQRFLQKISANNIKRKSVDIYAEELHITPKYLTLICKQISGKTALDWIEEYVMEDARFYLRSTEHSVKEVANILGFPNISFFGKYIKRNTGMSPRKYRKQLRGE